MWVQIVVFLLVGFVVSLGVVRFAPSYSDLLRILALLDNIFFRRAEK